MRVIGMDPAPTKETTFCISTGEDLPRFDACGPHDVLGRIEAWSNDGVPTLFLWDAPLGLDMASSRAFHSREIDAATQRWLKRTRRVADRAVGVSTAAQCPHNLLSQHVWGLPAGTAPKHGVQLVRANHRVLDEQHNWLAEVHPAVAVAAWWSARGPRAPMPRYKPGGKTRAADARRNLTRIVHVMDRILPDGPRPSDTPCGSHPWDDDHFDAWVAWRLGRDLVRGQARAVGPVHGGTYVLPKPVSWRDGELEVRSLPWKGGANIALGLVLWNELSERGPHRPIEETRLDAEAFLAGEDVPWNAPYDEATFDALLQKAIAQLGLPSNVRVPW